MGFGHYFKKSLAMTLVAVGGFNSISRAYFGEGFLEILEMVTFLNHLKGRFDDKRFDSCSPEEIFEKLNKDFFNGDLVEVFDDQMDESTKMIFYCTMHALFTNKPVFAKLCKEYTKKNKFIIFNHGQGEKLRDILKRLDLCVSEGASINSWYYLNPNKSYREVEFKAVPYNTVFRVNEFQDALAIGIENGDFKLLEDYGRVFLNLYHRRDGMVVLSLADNCSDFVKGVVYRSLVALFSCLFKMITYVSSEKKVRDLNECFSGGFHLNIDEAYKLLVGYGVINLEDFGKFVTYSYGDSAHSNLSLKSRRFNDIYDSLSASMMANGIPELNLLMKVVETYTERLLDDKLTKKI